MIGRLGLHVRPEEVVRVLDEEGIHVSLELVQQVRFELQKDSLAVGKRQPVLPRRPAVRRLPKGFPQRGRD